MIAVSPLPPPAVVVGKGRLGGALAAALGRIGPTPAVVGGRDAARAPEGVLTAIRSAGSGAVLLLAVRDDALEAVAAALAGAASPVPVGVVALHHSGSLDRQILAPLSAAGFSTGSCHPLQTFTGSRDDAARFEGVAFATEGEPAALEAADRLAVALGGRTVSIAPGARGLYHLAASLGANGLTGLVAASRDALAAAGLTPDDALAALGPLLRTALEEALRLGPEEALTGPAARDDEATLSVHRRALLAWDASRSALLESLLREQRRLGRRGAGGTGC